MSDDAKTPPGPLGQAVLAGAVVLGTGPFALALLVVLSAHEGEHALAGIASLVQEGGAFSYAVLLLGAMASLVAGVLAGLAVRRPRLPPGLALIPFLLPLAAALLGVISGMHRVVAATANVWPTEQRAMLLAGTAEVVSLELQALGFAAAGALAVALATLVTWRAAASPARLLTVLGAGTLGLSLVAAAGRDFVLRNGFSVISHASPADRPALLVNTIADWQQFSLASGALFLGCLVVTMAGLGVLVARGQKVMGLGAASALLVAAVGFRGFDALAERRLFGPGQEQTSQGRPDLLTFNGRHPLREDSVPLEGTEADIDEVVARACRNDGEHPWVAVELSLGLAREPLLRALQTAHYLRTEVELIGGGSQRPPAAPSQFAAAEAMVSDLPQSAPLRVLFPGEGCERCVGLATLTDAGLQLGAATWKQDEVPFFGEVADLPGVEFEWSAGSPAGLLRAALIALSHQHLLVVRVPPPQRLPVLPAD